MLLGPCSEVLLGPCSEVLPQVREASFRHKQRGSEREGKKLDTPVPYKGTPHTQDLKTAHWAPALNSSTTSDPATGEKKVFGGQSKFEGESTPFTDICRDGVWSI